MSDIDGFTDRYECSKCKRRAESWEYMGNDLWCSRCLRDELCRLMAARPEVGTPTQRFDFLTMLDELEAALKRMPKDGYELRSCHIEVSDECAAGSESVVIWDIEQADIEMLRAALSPQGTAPPR